MDNKQIEEISRVSKRENWPYPKTFQALKQAGVHSYDVEVAHHKITYFDGDSQFLEPIPEGFKELQIGKYCLTSFKEALKEIQSKKIDYATWLKKTAAAGITFYRVDMASNTITYSGSRPDETYQEIVPTAGE